VSDSVVRERGLVIKSLAWSLSGSNVSLDDIPGLVIRIVDEDMWRKYAVPEREWEVAKFRSFEEFVTTPMPVGLGISISALKDLCHRDLQAKAAIDEALKEDQPNGGDRRSVSFSLSNRQSESPPTGGGTQTVALRRLRKDRPDLHAKVLAGEMSANAAAVEAGFRHRTLTVRADDPEQAARTLRRFYKDPDDRQQIANRLTETGLRQD